MSYDSTILAESGLVSYWKLDETSGTTAADSKGTTPLTYTGGYTQGVAGVSGTAVTFNGSTGYVGSSTTSPTTAASNVTLEAWVNLASTSATRQPIVYSGDGNSNGFGLIVNGGTSPPTDGSLYYLLGGRSWNSTGVKLTTGWHHVVVVLDASSHATVYVDGGQVFTTTSTPATPSARFGIGTDWVGFLNGSADAVAVYNTPLSAARIGAHYVFYGTSRFGVGTGGRTSGDGVDASFNFGTTNPLAGSPNPYMMACCWINVVTWMTTSQSFFSQVSGSNGWNLQRSGTGQGVDFTMPGIGGSASTGTSVLTGNWVHVAGLVDSTGFAYLYVNGVNVANVGAAGGNPFASGNPLALGIPGANIAVAEPALFRNLTHAQGNTIAANLAAGQSPMIQIPTPVFYSHFGGGTTETDQVGGLTSTLPTNSYAVAGPTSYYSAAMLMHL